MTIQNLEGHGVGLEPMTYLLEVIISMRKELVGKISILNIEKNSRPSIVLMFSAMLIILNSISSSRKRNVKLKINNERIMFLFLYLSISCANAADVSIMKYGYGEIYWGSKASTPDPVVYPLKDSYAYERLIHREPNATTANLNPYYDFSDEENNLIQNERAMFASLKVWQRKHDILVQVDLHNKSNNDYFFYRGGMPSDDYGNITFGVMCGSSFRITSGNIKFDYLGNYCDFGDDRQNNWVDIKPGETFSFIVPINWAYEFLPGKHQYQIGTLEYEVVTKEWFTEVDTNDTMFRILDRHADCPIKIDCPLVTKKRFMCPEYDEETNDLRFILDEIGFDGGTSINYFLIRTNQVSITINADKNTSYHQMIRDIKSRR